MASRIHCCITRCRLTASWTRDSLRGQAGARRWSNNNASKPYAAEGCVRQQVVDPDGDCALPRELMAPRQQHHKADAPHSFHDCIQSRSKRIRYSHVDFRSTALQPHTSPIQAQLPRSLSQTWPLDCTKGNPYISFLLNPISPAPTISSQPHNLPTRGGSDKTKCPPRLNLNNRTRIKHRVSI